MGPSGRQAVRPTVPGPGPVLGPGPSGPDRGSGRVPGRGLGPGPRATVEKSENFQNLKSSQNGLVYLIVSLIVYLIDCLIV